MLKSGDTNIISAWPKSSQNSLRLSLVKGKKRVAHNSVILGESSSAIGVQSLSCANFNQPKASANLVVCDGQCHRPEARPRVTDVV